MTRRERENGEAVDKKKKWREAAEFAVVVLVTLIVFALLRRAALMKRGYAAFGGEYLLFLLPVLYYIGKGMKSTKKAGLRGSL